MKGKNHPEAEKAGAKNSPERQCRHLNYRLHARTLRESRTRISHEWRKRSVGRSGGKSWMEAPNVGQGGGTVQPTSWRRVLYRSSRRRWWGYYPGKSRAGCESYLQFFFPAASFWIFSLHAADLFTKIIRRKSWEILTLRSLDAYPGWKKKKLFYHLIA